MRRLALLVLCFGVLIVQTLSARAERRLALVIGNSLYQHVNALTNPANDAQDISSALQRLGFEVATKSDLTFNGFREALRDFSRTASGADKALIYFAGHGLELSGTNFLIPVDADLRTDTDVEFETIPLDMM